MVIRRWILYGILITWVGYFPAWRYSKVETNLGSSTELSWSENCGLHPLKTADGTAAGWALTATSLLRLELGAGCSVTSPSPRLCRAGFILALRVTTPMLRCKLMKEGKAQRLPVIAKNGTLAGVISVDDLPSRADPTSLGRQPEISTDEVVSLLVARQ